MSDERPRPQYGEYATPEQQEKAANKNLPQRRFVGPPIPPHEPPPPVTAENAPPGLYSTSRHPVDRFATIFMLGLGAFFLLTSVGSYFDFPDYLARAAAMFGAGRYPDDTLAMAVGIGLLVFHVGLYLATLVLSLRRLARGKWSFFVPMIGLAAFLVVSIAASIVLWSADPTYFDEMAKSFSTMRG